MEQLGFKEVITYIQSGNIVFKSNDTGRQTLEEKIKQGIANTFGFDVSVLVRTKSDLEKIMNNNPFSGRPEIETNKIYFVLLKDTPEKHLIPTLQKEAYKNEMFVITGGCVYLVCLEGYGNAKYNNNFFERKLKVSATTRNHKTMQKLLELANAKK